MKSQFAQNHAENYCIAPFPNFGPGVAVNGMADCSGMLNGSTRYTDVP